MSTDAPTPADAPAARRTPLVPLLTLLLLGNVSVIAVFTGASTLIPARLAEIDPANKEALWGTIQGISAVFATLFNPIGGALSDRTRSRMGRRHPWLLGSALIGFGVLAFLGSATTVVMIGIAWCLAQAVMNIFMAALTAIIPDRVLPARRGTASAVMGVGTSLGAIVGTQVAARYVDEGALAYLIFGGTVLVAALLFATCTRDPRPGEYEESQNVTLAESFVTFLAALKHRDFMWVWLGRALMVLGYFMVLMFMLFILSDYITLPEGLKPTDAMATAVTVSTVAGMAATIIGGPLSDWTGRRKLFVVASGVVTACALLIPLLVPTWSAFLIYAGLHGAAFGWYSAVDIALMTLILPRSEDAGRDMGVLNIANAGPQIIAPFIAASVIGAFGGYPALFITGMVISLVGAVAVLPVKSVR
ncbi:MFS transporter [Nocardiopsis composta]|uniref:MFS family permease n=1 Tax=Nocardiopsis composta TaxID=157465 RepID=A0A7W8VCZ6_9ACTN|nr:MFS transporter [Nocardiopsis composta]MBB5431485.1 MFS family permease [Nocardiopsis composta]